MCVEPESLTSHRMCCRPASRWGEWTTRRRCRSWLSRRWSGRNRRSGWWASAACRRHQSHGRARRRTRRASRQRRPTAFRPATNSASRSRRCRRSSRQRSSPASCRNRPDLRDTVHLAALGAVGHERDLMRRSGDQAGSASLTSALVSWRGAPPKAGTRQRCARLSSRKPSPSAL